MDGNDSRSLLRLDQGRGQSSGEGTTATRPFGLAASNSGSKAQDGTDEGTETLHSGKSITASSHCALSPSDNPLAPATAPTGGSGFGSSQSPPPPQVVQRPHRPSALPPPHPYAAALIRASSPLSSPPPPARASQSPESESTPAASSPNALTNNTHARWRPSPNSTPGASVVNTPMMQCFSLPDELGDPSIACDPVDMRSASEFNPRSKLVLELTSLKAGADDAIRAILATWNNNSSAFRNNPLAPQPSPLLLHIADSAVKLANDILTTSTDAVLRGSYAQDIVLSLHSWLIELRSHLSTVQARCMSRQSVAETMPLYPAAEALLTQLVFIWSPIARLTQVLHDTDINFQGARLIGTSLVDVANSPVLSATPGRGRASRPRLAESLAAVVQSARSRSKSVSRSSPALCAGSPSHAGLTRAVDSDHSSASPSFSGTPVTSSLDDVYHVSDIPPLPPITAEQRRLSSVLSLPPHIAFDNGSMTESDSEQATSLDIRLSSSPASVAVLLHPVDPATILRANDPAIGISSPELLSQPTRVPFSSVATISNTTGFALVSGHAHLSLETTQPAAAPSSDFQSHALASNTESNPEVTPLRLISQPAATMSTLSTVGGSPGSIRTNSPTLKVPSSPSIASFFKSVRSAVADSFLSPIRSRRLSSTTASDKRSLSPLGLTRASTHDGLSSTAAGIVRPASEASLSSVFSVSDRPTPRLRPRVSSTPTSPTRTRPKPHHSPSPRSQSPAGPTRNILCRICEEIVDATLMEEHTAFCKVSQQIELHLYRDDIQIRRIVGHIVKRRNDFVAAAEDAQSSHGASPPSELTRKQLKKLGKEADHLIKLGSRVADLDEKQPAALDKAKKCVGKLQSALDGVGNDGVHINDPLLRDLTQQLVSLSVDKLKNMKIYQDKVAPMERSVSRRSSNSSLASSGTSLDGHESDGSPAPSSTYSYRAMSLFQALLQGGAAFINATSGGNGRYGHTGMSAFAGALHPALMASTHSKSKTSPSASAPPTPPPKTKRDQSVSSSGSGGKRSRRGVSIEEFEFLKPISKGAFGRVYLGRKRVTGDLFAIKVLDKETMIRKNMLTHVMAERRALALANTPYVVRLYYAFMSSRHLFLVMEYMIGGDLSSLLAALGSFSKEMALFYTAEITAAVDYLHAASITHRDLKPDNVLIGADGHIKLTDFGLSKVTVKDQDPAFGSVDPVKSLSRFSSISRDKSDRAHHAEGRRSSGDRDCLGTPDYLAVELLLGIGHGPSVDYWALGCCLFEFLAGYPPFTDESPELIFRNILNHDVQWPQEEDEELPEDARDLIMHLLEPNVQKRFTATEIKMHSFFSSIDWTNISSMTAPFIPQPEGDQDTGYFDARNASRNIDVTRFSFYDAKVVDSGTFGRAAGAANASSDTGAISLSTTSSSALDSAQSISSTSESDKESRKRSAISSANQRRRSKLVDSCQAASGSSASESSPVSPSSAFVVSPSDGGEAIGAVDVQLEEFIAWKNVDVLGSLNHHGTGSAGSAAASSSQSQP